MLVSTNIRAMKTNMNNEYQSSTNVTHFLYKMIKNDDEVNDGVKLFWAGIRMNIQSILD